MIKKDKFRIRICSDLDYEKMVADVSYDNQTIAMITQEKGIENMEIEVFPPEKELGWKFPLNDFMETIVFAKNA